MGQLKQTKKPTLSFQLQMESIVEQPLVVLMGLRSSCKINNEVCCTWGGGGGRMGGRGLRYCRNSLIMKWKCLCTRLGIKKICQIVYFKKQAI